MPNVVRQLDLLDITIRGGVNQKMIEYKEFEEHFRTAISWAKAETERYDLAHYIFYDSVFDEFRISTNPMFERGTDTTFWIGICLYRVSIVDSEYTVIYRGFNEGDAFSYVKCNTSNH